MVGLCREERDEHDSLWDIFRLIIPVFMVDYFKSLEV